MTDPLLGRRLGRYEIRGPLGRGGMSRVYRALDHNLQREVALKVLDDRMFQETEFAERFRREAHTLAALRHPGIVPIYDYGTEDGVTYIAEQLLAGPTLERELADLKAQGRRMDRPAVLQVITQLADALDYAHSQGVIHRDLKPSNVIRNAHGDVLLTDFGIAVNLASALRQTQTGQMLGTPAYLSPEQAQGSSTLTPASDVYALGVMLFEVLTGRVPFENTQPMAVALAHVQQPPPSPSNLRPDLPRAVEQVVLRALAKDPAARFPSAGALARALATAWATPPPARQPAAVPPPIHEQQTVVNPSPPLPRTSTVVPAPASPSPRPSQASPPPVTRRPTTTNQPVAAPAPVRPQGSPSSRRGPWIALLGVLLALVVIGVVVANVLRTVGDTTGAPTAAIVVPTAPVDQPTAEAPTEVPPTAAPTEVAPTEVAPTEVAPTEVAPTEVPSTAVQPTEVSPTEIPPTDVPATEPTAPLPTLEPPPTGPNVFPIPVQISDMEDVIDTAVGQQIDPQVAQKLKRGLKDVEDAIRSGDKETARKKIPDLQEIVDKGRADHNIKSQVADRLTLLLKSLDAQLQAG